MVFKIFFRRFGRLLGVIVATPARFSPNDLAVWLHYLACCLFDVLGGPEMVQLFLRALTDTRPLTDQEIGVASAILGDDAIRYECVRLAQGGILTLAFGLNKNRAFATWHTINMPWDADKDLPLLVHELTHTYQFERVGSVYIGQALLEQKRYGRAAYFYGGAEGLRKAYADGKCYRDYNREQQGKITQDYCACILTGEDSSAYRPFIADLRAGII